MYEMKILEDRIVQTAWMNRNVFSMPSGWAFVKFENCFHTGGGEGDLVVVVGFCGVAIFARTESLHGFL